MLIAANKSKRPLPTSALVIAGASITKYAATAQTKSGFTQTSGAYHFVTSRVDISVVSNVATPVGFYFRVSGELCIAQSWR